MEPSPRRPGGRAAGLRVAEGCAGPAGGQPTGRDKVADGSHSVDQGAGGRDPLGSTRGWVEWIQSSGFKGRYGHFLKNILTKNYFSVSVDVNVVGLFPFVVLDFGHFWSFHDV